jgi:4-hydroxy-2-oxoheptanedioate aldolase
MERRSFMALPLGLAALAAPAAATAATSGYTPKRVNKAIELLEQGQPVYYTMGMGGYDAGVKMAKTWADIIIYDMEHGPIDMTGLREFMRGLVDGGPTKSGHRTPAVIPQLPAGGWDAASMLANAWMVQQVLAQGAHGIHLCHATDPAAIRVMVQYARYAFNKAGVGANLPEGRRGSGGQTYGSEIWGITAEDYMKKADPWPLNPEGELLLGIKIENRFALENAEKSAAVPGLGFGEWGPGDMGISMGHPMHREPYPPEMQKARARVLAACKANKVAFLNLVNVDDVDAMIKEGVMVGAGNEEAADKGRKITKRSMPW